MDDFGDFGIDMSEFSSELGSIENNNAGYDIDGGRNDYKRTAKIAVVSGILIIALALGITGFMGKLKEKERAELSQEIAEKKRQEQIADNSNNAKIVPVRVRPNNKGNSWVPFKQDDDLYFENEIEALFTITNIDHMAKVSNERKDIQIKSTVKGNISGLSGEYEIDIPYDKARVLDEGTVFTVIYSYTTKNNILVVGEIKY